MTLTNRERRHLERLALWPPGEVAELQVDGERLREVLVMLRGLEDRGYVKLSNGARCGLERLRGNFVRITAVGREVLKQPPQPPCQPSTPMTTGDGNAP